MPKTSHCGQPLELAIRQTALGQAPAMIELLAKLAADEALPGTARVSAINTILKASGLGFKPGVDEKPVDRSKPPSHMTAAELGQMIASLRTERDTLAEEMAQASTD